MSVSLYKMFAVKCLLVVMAAVAAHGFALGAADVVMHCFTRNNPDVSEAFLPTPASIMTSVTFAPTRDTTIIIHSYDDSVAGNSNAFIIPALLSVSDLNVISVDWSLVAEMYSHALGKAPQVGRVVANFINVLQNSFNYSPTRITIVGVGLGGHIAGIAARNINGATIPRIVAIDPSLHGWSHHPEILNANDADVVEVLHATAAHYGYDFPLGDIDFYPNGGSRQTGCSTDVSCSHIYAYAFFAESMTREVNGGNAFVGSKCDSYEQAVSQQCTGDSLEFGGTAPKTGESGIYWFATNPTPPFARG